MTGTCEMCGERHDDCRCDDPATYSLVPLDAEADHDSEAAEAAVNDGDQLADMVPPVEATPLSWCEACQRLVTPEGDESGPQCPLCGALRPPEAEPYTRAVEARVEELYERCQALTAEAAAPRPLPLIGWCHDCHQLVEPRVNDDGDHMCPRCGEECEPADGYIDRLEEREAELVAAINAAAATLAGVPR